MTPTIEPAEAPDAPPDSPSPARGPYRAPHRLLRGMERFFEVALGLEHGANVFPLLHVVLYYAVFLTLACGWIQTPWLAVPLWVAMVLLNYSLSIGILHLHAHRKLFNHKFGNRLLELLLAIPCGLSYPVMRYVHVFLHHKYSDGPGDPTSTRGMEKGWAAVAYWLRYPVVCHRATARGLFAPDAAPVWKKLRFQYVFDTLAALLVVGVYGALDPIGMLLFYLLPLVVTTINIGYFAWLTHAPADHGPVDGSVNTTNNWMNLFIHNQGYHAVHHRYPAIHWTKLPDHLGMMRSVSDALIVPYWVTLESAVRLLRPRSFRNAAHGKDWKGRYEQRVSAGRHRLWFLPYFGWIR